MAEGNPPDSPLTVGDIGEAIRRGVALLEQQSVPAPVFQLRSVHDAYTGGIRAVKPRAPPNRVRQAWSDAAGELPPPMPATVERAIEELEDEPTVTRVVVATYEVMTASRLAKAQSRRLAPNLAKAASTSVPRDGAGARLAIAARLEPGDGRRGGTRRATAPNGAGTSTSAASWMAPWRPKSVFWYEMACYP